MAKDKITTSSTAEYFSKNLQQVGFSSATKAVLTTLKEAVDNSLDACEDAGILPELNIEIEKKGNGTLKNTDLIRIKVEDNGPGLDLDDVPKVFGEYLASSKFGRGRCSRGQQGIGISAATTWAQLTSARGAQVTTKTKRMRNAVSMVVNVDIRHNKGLVKNKESLSKWDRQHGLSVEFLIDGRVQLNGEGGLLTYLQGTTLVNPHLTLTYKLPDQEKVVIKRVEQNCPQVPDATMPHPHTMKLGEFIHHSHLFGPIALKSWLKKGFTRVSDNIIEQMVKHGLKKEYLAKPVNKLHQSEMKEIFAAVQKTELMAPTTRSVMTIGEAPLALSIRRMGEIDFFSVVTRKPKICDSKPVAIEVAIARFLDRQGPRDEEDSAPVTVLRFANRVPLQFDKSACAVVRAIETVNWRSYGISQRTNNLPLGPYVFAVSVVSPFIKFKNASKETIDASDELVEEIRRALMQAGQRLSRHIRREKKADDLERKKEHIEQFGPILVSALCRIVKAPAKRKKQATDGLVKLLGRELNQAKEQLVQAEVEVKKVVAQREKRLGKGKGKKDEDAEAEA
ncbi:MAG: DNA topoisomerase VI subunit B [Bdellovibrionaceae bacterium]|nr:DNA topoisomerase VI subunit B [Bdellovibrionales bacterium]MCB9253300.1 DNA topoisomerase VI subunit B [Pseudobdellovibrionaceae bacterium]